MSNVRLSFMEYNYGTEQDNMHIVSRSLRWKLDGLTSARWKARSVETHQFAHSLWDPSDVRETSP